MLLGNPLPVLLGIPLMACFCWLLDRWIPVLDAAPAHAKTLPLDGLRGLLASAVFFHHAYITYGLFHTGRWDPPASAFYAQLGPTAVTCFFFISGYLFWGKMLKDPESLRPGRLLPNRMRRILPAYWCAVLIFFLLSVYFTGPRLLVTLRVLCCEIVSWILSGFPIPGGPSFNGVDPLIATGGIFWTLQQEWLFYLLLPLMARFRPRRRLVLLAVLLFIAGKVLSHAPIHNLFAWDILSIVIVFTRMFLFGFVIGMLSAYGIASEKLNAVLRSPWMTPVAAACVATQLLLISPLTIMHNLPPVFLVPVFFMIVAGNDFGGLLSSRPLRCLGAVSYSLYVFHGLVLRTLTVIFDRRIPIGAMAPFTYWLWMVPVGLVVVLWSTVSYRFLERPFFAVKKRPATPAVLPA